MDVKVHVNFLESGLKKIVKKDILEKLLQGALRKLFYLSESVNLNRWSFHKVFDGFLTVGRNNDLFYKHRQYLSNSWIIKWLFQVQAL